MPSIYQAYYWYNSTIFYQFTLSLAFLFVAAFAKYRNTQRQAVRGVLIACLVLLAVMIGGSNFPLGLVMAAAFAIYMVAAFIKKFEHRKTDAILFAIYMVIFLANVLAPGNGARQGAYSVNPGLFGAAYASVRDMLVETPEWISSTVTIGIICAMLPLSHKIVQNSKIKFVHPAIAGADYSFPAAHAVLSGGVRSRQQRPRARGKPKIYAASYRVMVIFHRFIRISKGKRKARIYRTGFGFIYHSAELFAEPYRHNGIYIVQNGGSDRRRRIG